MAAQRCAKDGSGFLRSAKREAGAGMLIPGLPNEVALMILVRLPRSLHGVFRAVSCSWRDALQPYSVSPLRNSLRITEMWAFFLFQDRKFVLYDPLLQRFSASTELEIQSHRVEILGATSNKVIFIEFSGLGFVMQGIHCLDAESMKWRPYSAPFWPYSFVSSCDFGSAATTDGFVWVVGGSSHCAGPRHEPKTLTRVARLDVKTMTWEKMPKMHQSRIMPAVVGSGGRLYVIGGHVKNGNRLELVPSGEMWDPTCQKWRLEPELWPSELRTRPTLRIAVALDTLYAVMSITGCNVRKSNVEIMHYESSFKRWTSLGNVPVNEHSCGSCGDSYTIKCVLGVGQELWVVLSCFWPHSECTDTVLSCIPGAGVSPLLWRTVPFPSGSKYSSMPRIIGQGVVHV